MMSYSQDNPSLKMYYNVPSGVCAELDSVVLCFGHHHDFQYLNNKTGVKHFLRKEVGEEWNVCGIVYPYLKVSTSFLLIFSIPSLNIFYLR